MKVRCSPTATADLDSILDYIASDNPSAALKIGLLIDDSRTHLRKFPLSGRLGRIRSASAR